MVLRRLSFAAAVILCLVSNASAAIIADLAQNFSATNPNVGAYGTWSYNAGAVPLTFQSNPGNIGTPGYGTALNESGDYLPAMIQIPADNYTGNGITFDALKGDIVIHTTDQANGVDPVTGQENGPADILWTSLTAGNATVSGILWTPSLLFENVRENDYEIILNPGAGQSILGSGKIPQDGTNSRANPISFSYPNVTISPGSVVELQLTQDASSPYGYLTGADLTISVPEPASLPLLALAAIGLMMRRRRHRGCGH
jgi:hypothetical protein